MLTRFDYHTSRSSDNHYTLSEVQTATAPSYCCNQDTLFLTSVKEVTTPAASTEAPGGHHLTTWSDVRDVWWVPSAPCRAEESDVANSCSAHRVCQTELTPRLTSWWSAVDTGEGGCWKSCWQRTGNYARENSSRTPIPWMFWEFISAKVGAAITSPSLLLICRFGRKNDVPSSGKTMYREQVVT